MTDRMTDKKAIRIALRIAMDTEYDLIEAYRDPLGKIDETEDGVKIARKNIAAFQRVLDRYFGGGKSRIDKAIEGARAVTLTELMRGQQ